MDRTSGDRRGFALPATMGALVIIGVLVTAGFYMARQELRIGVASNHAHMAVNIAQAGANEVMANWNGFQLNNVPVWADTTISGSVDAGTWSVNIARTSDFMFYLTANGQVTEGGQMWSGANRTIGIVTKLLFADINPPAALLTRGGVSVKGNAEIVGIDQEPGPWGGFCSGTHDNAGLITNDTTNLSLGGNGVSGNPPYDQDSTLVDSTFTNFGDMDWAELTALAQLEGKDVSSLGTNINGTGPVVEEIIDNGVTPPDTTHVCDATVLTNWGDPDDASSPCFGYFPLIYHAGPTLRIQSGGVGQGVLLVDGTLDLRGGFVFYGIIIVQGSFETQGSGNRIVGAVMASNATLDEQSFVGGSTVQYSSCGVRRALLNNASLSRARPLAQRSWYDVSSLVN